MSKYIIKNCPAILKMSKICDDYRTTRDNPELCKNINDCILKQIVKLCNGIKCPCDYKGADCWECTESGARRFADKILKLLDIQEVE